MSDRFTAGRTGRAALAVACVAGGLSVATTALGQDGMNACPVDGCIVQIVSAERAGDEIKVVFDANFVPDLSKNHFHVWWGENYSVEQVSGNAESFYGVEQGIWHPIDDYPEYTTTGDIAVAARGEAVTLCATASGRNHDILDPTLVSCMSVADLVN